MVTNYNEAIDLVICVHSMSLETMTGRELETDIRHLRCLCVQQ